MSFPIVWRRYSAGSSRRFSPFFSDRFERRGLVYVGASIQHKTALDAVFAEYDFTWDAGNRIIEIDSTDGTAEYTYDKIGQLTGADYDYIADELYTYDDNGNRTNAGYVTGENNETLSDGVYRYSYDNEGNRTEKFLWTDTNNDGIIDASEKTLVQTYEWDYRNRLESVTNYENGIAKEVINYLYDYLNLMIERTVTDAATSILQSSEYNLYSNGQVVLEYDTTSSVDVVKSVNLWGANIDELAAVEKIALSVNDNNVILWTYGDHLNSIRDVLIYDSITQTAAVVNHLIYNAFGILVSSTDGYSVNPISISPLLKYRYTGKFFDDSTGLQNNINRWYDNTTGKWISVDPIGFNGRDSNLYRYVGNHSIALTDFQGFVNYFDPNRPPIIPPKSKPTPKPLPKHLPSNDNELLITGKYKIIGENNIYNITGGNLNIKAYLSSRYGFVNIRISYKPSKKDDCDRVKFIQIVKPEMDSAKEKKGIWELDGAGEDRNDENVDSPWFWNNGFRAQWYNDEKKYEYPMNNASGVTKDGVWYMIDEPGSHRGDYNAEFYTGVVCISCRNETKWLGYIHWRLDKGKGDFKLTILDYGDAEQMSKNMKIENLFRESINAMNEKADANLDLYWSNTDK